MFTVAVLGAVEARRDGVLLPVPAGKTTELLARLAFDAGTPVRRDVLLDDLWSQPTGRNTLQSKVSQLRRALGDKDLVVGSGDGYTLAVGPEGLDHVTVGGLASAASAARAAGDPASALASATQGLALFRGDVLMDVGDWAVPHRARLEEVRMGLVEDAVAARVDLGSGGDVVGELEGLVGQHPLREGLWASLVTALYRAGRQADALAAYSRVRRLLIDELGVEPGAELRAVEHDVLSQSPALAPSTRALSAARPGNLPAAASPLVGREDDLKALASLVAEQRLVSVVGTAGVGKTRVALEVARGLTAPGGVWLVRLDAVDASADLAQVVADAMSVPGGGPALGERLAGAATVLVLDNCEHVVEGAAALATSLLDAAPGLTVVATSQVALGLDDEEVYLLEPLSQLDSVALFAERARKMRRGFELDGDTAALVDEVCRSLDGLPLAIELAAARVRSLSMRDIVRHLDDRFALLHDPTSHRPERRRALAGAIAWSYDLLFPDDQQVLWALSCFAGSASLDATEHVVVALGVPAGAVPDTIARLVDRSLVGVDVDPAGDVRYRLLDSIRTFAADRMRESGHAAAALAAHASWYAQVAMRCDAQVRGSAQPECLAVARAERENVDAALAWCAANDPELGGRIATGFGWTWVVLGDGVAGAARVRDAVALVGPGQHRLAGLLTAGWLEASAGDLVLAQADLDAAQAIAVDLGDDRALADVQRHLAFLRIQQGRADEVVSCAVAALATYRDLDLPWPAAGSLLLAAFGALMGGDTVGATRDGVASIAIMTRLGDSWALVHAEAMLAGIAQAEHRFDDAAAALTRAAEESRALGFLGQTALHLTTLARVRQRAGQPAEAASSFHEAIAAALAVGDARLACTARLHFARLRRAAGDHDAAVALLEENLRWYASAGGGDGELLSRCLLHAERGDPTALREVLAAAVEQADDEVRVLALDALARAAATGGDRARSRELLAEADGLLPKVAYTVDQADRTDRIRTLELLAL